jgi:transposase
MEMLGKVRRMHLRDKLSLHEISKRTGLSRNTLRKWLRKSEAEVVAPPRYQRGEAPNKLTPYHAALEQALKADAYLSKHHQLKPMCDLLHQARCQGRCHGVSPAPIQS